MNQYLVNIGRDIVNTVYLSRQGDDVVQNVPPLRILSHRDTELERPVAPALQLPPMCDDVTERILRVLLSGSVRRGSRSLIAEHIPTLRDRIAYLVSYDQPISFILPAFPFKDQSPFTTAASIDHVDLGEYAFLHRCKGSCWQYDQSMNQELI